MLKLGALQMCARRARDGIPRANGIVVCRSSRLFGFTLEPLRSPCPEFPIVPASAAPSRYPAVWLPARASSQTGDVDTGSGRCHLGPATLALKQAGRRTQHLDNCTTSTASSIPPNGPSRFAAVEARHSRSHTDISYSLCVCREETVSCETSCLYLHPANTRTREHPRYSHLCQ
jgi:hypothetical protein